MGDSGAKFRVLVSNSAGSATNNDATLTVNLPPPPTSTTDVVTYHNDIARTGQNLNETILTPANVNSTTFGKIRSLPVDGKVDAQPLYLSSLQNIAGGTHNVLYVARLRRAGQVGHLPLRGPCQFRIFTAPGFSAQSSP